MAIKSLTDRRSWTTGLRSESRHSRLRPDRVAFRRSAGIAATSHDAAVHEAGIGQFQTLASGNRAPRKDTVDVYCRRMPDDSQYVDEPTEWV